MKVILNLRIACSRLGSICTAQLLSFGSGSSAGLSLTAQLALDDGELHTRLPHPNITCQYGAVLVSGRGTMCVPVPTILFPTSIALCPDLNLKCATGRWDGQTTGCDFLWGFPPG